MAEFEKTPYDIPPLELNFPSNKHLFGFFGEKFFFLILPYLIRPVISSTLLYALVSTVSSSGLKTR